VSLGDVFASLLRAPTHQSSKLFRLKVTSTKMRSSIFTLLFITAFTAAQSRGVYCPILPYDARPGYNLECVHGDQNGVYKDQLVTEVVVEGGTFNGKVLFQCTRQVGE
jgi:hypothetical protein